MIEFRRFRWTVSLSLVTGMSLMGQKAPASDIPLKSWAAPLYWQPSQAEHENAAKSVAQIQFPPNATSNTALVFVAVSPCRLVDTRGASAGFIGSTPFNGPYIQAGQTVAFPVQSTTEAATTAPPPCGKIPSFAQAYSVNLTLVPHPLGAPVNYVTMWPDNGSAIPSVSTVNDQQGAVVSNAAIVPAGTNSCGIQVFAYGPTDVIIDMNGFYAAPSDTLGNTAAGAGTLSSLTTGFANTANGWFALYSDTTGYSNAAIGDLALYSNTTGSGNTATGTEALYNNTIGSGNTATGLYALLANTTGQDNNASGYLALSSNTIGGMNEASGYEALHFSTTASNNTASGYQALYSTTIGGDNTAGGSQALFSNTSGVDNTSSGSQALYSNTTGHHNTATGAGALFASTTGIYNTASGGLALNNNTTGFENTASGEGALLSNTSGGVNTASGYQALSSNTTGFYNR